jgi:type II secretory pathway pseudopilin PulG
MPLSRRWLPRLVVESGLIVFSILLAFALNGWWQSRQRTRLAEQALANFRREIQLNRSRLQEVMPYHASLRDQFQVMLAGGNVRTFANLSEVEGFQGFRPAFLTNTAWQAALVTGALTYLDYDTVGRLSELYTLQDRFVTRSEPDFARQSGSFSEDNIGSTLVAVVMYLGDVTIGERELLEAFDVVLQFLENRKL